VRHVVDAHRDRPAQRPTGEVVVEHVVALLVPRPTCTFDRNDHSFLTLFFVDNNFFRLVCLPLARSRAAGVE
jgi:hypothetical protein